ncbi:MAG: MlaD family protein [Bacteroidota bacterium]|nr:MlaD family protein [Bacteroidota bacterium]
MKKQNGNKIKLGIFVSIGLLLFIVAIYFIGKKQQLFNSTIKLSALFKDISGLQVGNNVRFSGINVGTVENIVIVTDTTVMIDMIIDKKTKKFIKKNAKAVIGTDGLMGNKIVLILPGTGAEKEIEDNDFVTSVKPISMDDILLKLKITGDNAANITEDLSVITQNIRSGKGTIGKLFMDTVFAENIDQTIINIKQGAGGFKQNMNAASNNILLRGFFKKKKDKNK